jgi:hypothetical protein
MSADQPRIFEGYGRQMAVLRHDHGPEHVAALEEAADEEHEGLALDLLRDAVNPDLSLM